MTKKQVTAVDWLVNFFEDYFALIPVDIIEQAKAMEKKQIIDAFNNGENKSAEIYYNETFEP